MRRSETSCKQRDGYTLIELLVVIGIITLLAGLLLQVIVKVRAVGPRVKTAAEISQLELAVESFKTTYNVKYVPSALILSNDYAATASAEGPAWLPALQDSQQYLSKVWPRVSWRSSPNPALPYIDPKDPIQLDGNQVLLFLLGGVPGVDNHFIGNWAGTRAGFLNSPTNPFNMSGGVAYSPPTGDKAKNGGPFFNFKVERVDQNAHYLDPYGTPYYYFSARNGNDYRYFGQVYSPAITSMNTNGGYGGMDPFIGADGKYIRSDAFQIISAGNNKLPGPGGAFEPGIGAYAPGGAGGDDIANFHKGMLGGDE